MYKIYCCVEGRKPKLLNTIDLPHAGATQQDFAKAVEGVVAILNAFPREPGMQLMVMRSGLVEAVESQTMGKLIWCN